MEAIIAYAASTAERPRYYANDHSRDRVPRNPQVMDLIDGRAAPPSIDREGFALVPHASAFDFSDPSSPTYRAEIAGLVQQVTGADTVIITAPGVMRFSERSGQAGSLNNSMPARFAHVDISDATAAQFSARAAPADKTIRRSAHFNVWRALSAPPQDVPLAVCDARSWTTSDLIKADAIFDEAGKDEWSFEGLVVAHNPAHRWFWFPNMAIDEVLVFKTHDSDLQAPHCVPHVAFDNPACPAEAPPRASIEMRAIAYWFA